MKDQIEQLIERRLIENLLENQQVESNSIRARAFLPMDKWLELKAAAEQHRLNQTKRKLAALKH